MRSSPVKFQVSLNAEMRGMPVGSLTAACSGFGTSPRDAGPSTFVMAPQAYMPDPA